MSSLDTAGHAWLACDAPASYLTATRPNHGAGRARRSCSGDTGYDSDDNRQQLLIHGTSPVIKPHPNRKNIPPFDHQAYRNRNQIERMFNRLKQSRRVATRYDKNKSSFQGLVTLAAISKWLKSFVHKP